jgi:hypothetical protein
MRLAIKSFGDIMVPENKTKQNKTRDYLLIKG